MMSLSKLSSWAARLPAQPAAQRPALVAEKLPDLTALASNTAVADETAIRILTAAIRAISPGHVKPASRTEAIDTATALLAGRHRGRGRPPIGPAVEVALSPDTHTWLEGQMRKAGVTKKADMVRRVIEYVQTHEQLTRGE